jgi:chromosome segregation ATPase
MKFISDSESYDYREIIADLLVDLEHFNRRLHTLNEICEELRKQVSKLAKKNQELSWAACTFDAESKSCEDYLQEREQ